MDILPSFLLGNGRRPFSLLMISLLVLGGLGPMLLMAVGTTAAGNEETQFEPLAPKPGERSGVWNLDNFPPEYEISGSSSGGYFGQKMKKLDFNGDGNIDLAISAYYANNYKGAVYIFDGSYQVTFPNLREDASTAKWTIDGSSIPNSWDLLFGVDFVIGDVNGDGYDDILIGAPGANAPNSTSSGFDQQAGGAFLFYGGPFRDSETLIAGTAANASFWGDQEYQYFGKPVGLGDMDGDGCDEVFVVKTTDVWEYEWGWPDNPDYYWWTIESNCYYWFGSSSFTGNHYIKESTKDYSGRISTEVQHAVWDYLPSWYDSYNFSAFANGNIASGDMDGDGREEIAFGTPYEFYVPYWGAEDYWNPGAVWVFHPGSNIKTPGSVHFMTDDDTYGDWQHYMGQNTEYSSYYVGYPISMYDYNQDDYMDLAIGAPRYPSYGQGSLYLVKGSSTYTTGDLEITDSSVYDVAFNLGGVSEGGAHAWGDYDGDAKPDIAVGGRKAVWVIENAVFNLSGSGNSVSASTSAMLTLEGPSDSYDFCHPGYPYTWMSDSPAFPIVLWNRDEKDLCADLFVSDYYYSVGNDWGVGKVWGMANYDMFGIGSFEAKPGDGPDENLYFAEYREYGFAMSAWNKWDILGTDRMVAELHIGSYDVVIEYTKGVGVQVIEDPLGAVRLDPNYYITTNPGLSMMYVNFNLTFTFVIRNEVDISVDFSVYAAHILYSDEFDKIASLRNKFEYVGSLEHYWIKPAGKEWINPGAWMPGNSMIEFTGIKLVYNGTEEFENGPFYPRDEVFYMELKNSFGNSSIDNTSSGRNFTLEVGVENMPIEVEFWIEQKGIPVSLVMNEVPGFYVKVDIDTPTAPPGIQVHADDYDDPNTAVDNDGELYATWQVPGEYNSGIDHYEVIVNGDESNITIVKSTFAKIFTQEIGRIDISVRAMDRVEHYGEWGSSFIFIDKETLEFNDFFPGPEVWSNTLSPEIGITITDVGGRFVVGSSVEYSISYDGGEIFEDWISAGSVLNAKDLTVIIEPILMEGSANSIKFRAMDEAGNLLESEAHQVNIDVSGVMFGDLLVDGSDEWEGTWLDSNEFQMDITVSDDLSGVDAETIEYRMTTAGRSDLDSAVWMPVEGLISGNEVDIVLENLEFGCCDRNYIQFRARDLLENPLTNSPAFNIWINTHPAAVIFSPENGTGFLEGDMITFDASPTSDYDGDELTFTWMDTFDGESTVIGEGSAEDFERFQLDTLVPGIHSIMLTVSDGLHEVSTDPIEILIEDYIPPIWNTDQDQDQDGMPNWFEFNFHLGWDDPSNKDPLYNPATDSSKSKSELWALFEPEYANKTVQVTEANDFDGDGHTDYEEFLADTDPTDGSSYPIYASPGDDEGDALNILLLIAIIISILLVIAVLVFLIMNSMAIKNKLEEEVVKDSEDEQAMLEKAMLAGGSARLDALKAASEGRPVALPMAPPTENALPAGAEGAGEAQPIEPTPMGQPQPVDQTPAPMEPSPAPQPIDAQGGFPPQ